MLIGYMRVSKADGSQVLDLQRDALLATGDGAAQPAPTAGNAKERSRDKYADNSLEHSWLAASGSKTRRAAPQEEPKPTPATTVPKTMSAVDPA